MVVYYINKVSDKLRTYTFPIKEGDICLLHEGDIIKTVYIDSEVEDNSIFRDFCFVDTKSLRSYRFPNTDSILCAPYGKSKAKGDKALVSLLVSVCNGEWLTDFLNDTRAILEGTREYWDLTILRRLTGKENIEIVFETPIEESFVDSTLKLVFLPDSKNYGFYVHGLNLSVGDYCFCKNANSIALMQINKESEIIDNISDFRLIERINEPEIMLPLRATILYDYTKVKEDKFLSRLNSIVKQPVSKSILFCAINGLPLSEDENVDDNLDEEDKDNSSSENKYFNSLFLEIIETFKQKIEQRNYSILKDLVTGVPKNEVARNNNLSQERIRQLYKKALEEVKLILKSDVKEKEQLRKENLQLKIQAQLYTEEIDRLKKVIKDNSLKEITNQTKGVETKVGSGFNTPTYCSKSLVNVGFIQIDNSKRKCQLLNRRGERLYSSTGKILFSKGEYYRVNYVWNSITISKIERLNNGKFSTGRKIVYAQFFSPMYSSLNEKSYLSQIEIIERLTDGNYKVMVNGEWFDENGYQADSILSSNGNLDKSENKYKIKDETKEYLVKVGDWILWKPTNEKGKVIELKKERNLFVIQLENGNLRQVYNNRRIYEILKKR